MSKERFKQIKDRVTEDVSEAMLGVRVDILRGYYKAKRFLGPQPDPTEKIARANKNYLYDLEKCRRSIAKYNPDLSETEINKQVHQRVKPKDYWK